GRIAPREPVDPGAAAEHGEERRVVTRRVDTDPCEVRNEVEGYPPVHDSRHVLGVEQEHVGRIIAGERREQHAVVLVPRRDRLPHELEAGMAGEIGCHQPLLELGRAGARIDAIGQRERAPSSVFSTAAARPARQTQRDDAPHTSRAPAASNRWRCCRSSVTPTRSPGRKSGKPPTRATTRWPPASTCMSVSAPNGSITRTSAVAVPWSGAPRRPCTGRTPRWISPSYCPSGTPID